MVPPFVSGMKILVRTGSPSHQSIPELTQPERSQSKVSRRRPAHKPRLTTKSRSES